MLRFFNKGNPSKKLYKGIAFTVILLLLLFSLYRNSGLFYRKGIILPFSLHLNRQEIYLIKGEEFRLFVYGINKRVSFYSTNPRVAGVNFNGRVYAYQTGKAIIIAKVDEKRLKCRVRVIDLSRDKLSLKVGDSYHLRIKGPAFYASYRSENPEVVSVSIFGRIKAKKPGRSTIIVKVKGKTLKSIVTVR